MTHFKRTTIAAALALGMAAAAHAQSPAPSKQGADAPSIERHVQGPGEGAQVPDGTVMASEVVTLKGRVADIDPATRRVLLEGEDGRSAIITVGEEVSNFDRLKRGDRVNARFSRAIALHVVKDGDDVRSLTEGGSHREPGSSDRPEGASAQYSTVVADVFNVDRENGLVTLRGPQGDMVDVEVEDQAALERLKEGDQVVASIVEAASVSIEPLARLDLPDGQ